MISPTMKSFLAVLLILLTCTLGIVCPEILPRLPQDVGIIENSQQHVNRSQTSRRDIHRSLARQHSVVPSLANEYLIQFHANISHKDFRAHTATIHANVQRYSSGNERYAGVLRHFSIGSGFRALHGHLDPKHVEQLKQLDVVKRIEPNGIVTTQLDGIPKKPNFNVKVHVHDAENWGQSRLSHRLPNFAPKYRYIKPPLPPTVYMLDTGVRITHSEFHTSLNSPPNTTTANSKVRFGPNFTVPPDHPDRLNSADDNGHGTHTAGIVAGNTYGIVPRGHPVHLVAVKVLGGANGSGTWDGVIQAIEWAGNDTVKRALQSRAVINMSLGGGRLQTVNDAVTAVVDHAKVTVVVAAGNDNNLTSNLSPASCPVAITVAATDQNDTRAGFSSYGPEVVIFAPGVNILSTGYGDDRAGVYMDGTSMAAPHVAGLAAYFMMVYGAHTPEEMRQRLLAAAVKGVVKDKGGGSTDALAHNGVGDPEEDEDS